MHARRMEHQVQMATGDVNFVPAKWRVGAVTTSGRLSSGYRRHVHFFRVCYRVFVYHPKRIRLKIDRLDVVVPEVPDDPDSELMMITTQNSENRIGEISPDVLAGLAPDRTLPFDDDGVFIEELDPAVDYPYWSLIRGASGVYDADAAGDEGMVALDL